MNKRIEKKKAKRRLAHISVVNKKAKIKKLSSPAVFKPQSSMSESVVKLLTIFIENERNLRKKQGEQNEKN